MNKIPFVAATLLMFASTAFAKPAPLSCPQKAGGDLGVNNEQVLEWVKSSQKESIRARAHISGKVVAVLPSMKVKSLEKEPDKFKGKHQRFDVKIGPGKYDIVQVFYNGRYSPRPAVKKGDTVEACGEFAADYTSEVGKGNRYAVVYWVHSATAYPHPEGYVQSGGTTYGTKVAKKVTTEPVTTESAPSH
jgi:hypothetical protein